MSTAGRPIQKYGRPFKLLTDEEKEEYIKEKKEKMKLSTYRQRDSNREEYNKYMRELHQKNKKTDRPRGRPKKEQ